MIRLPVRRPSSPGERSNGKSRVRPAVVNLNLIPAEFRRPLVTRSRLIALTVIITGSLVLPRLYDARLASGDSLADLRQQQEVTQASRERELRRVTAEKSEAAKLGEQLTRLKEENTQRNTLSLAQGKAIRRVELAPALEIVLANQTSGLGLTVVRWQEPNLTIEGNTDNLQSLMAYTQRLEESGRFRQLRLRLLDEMADKAGDAKAAPAPAPRITPTAAPALRVTPAPVRPVLPAPSLSFVLDLEVLMVGKS